MAVTAQVKQTLTIDGANLTGGSGIDYSGGALARIDKDLAIGTNVNVTNFAVDKDTLKVFYALSTGDCTVKTNSSGSPDNTITLKANVPLVWKSDDPSAGNPIGVADVASVYVTNAVAINLKIYAIHGTA